MADSQEIEVRVF